MILKARNENKILLKDLIELMMNDSIVQEEHSSVLEMNLSLKLKNESSITIIGLTMGNTWQEQLLNRNYLHWDITIVMRYVIFLV